MLHATCLLDELRMYWRIFTGRSPWIWEHLCGECRSNEKSYAWIALVLFLLTVLLVPVLLWAFRA